MFYRLLLILGSVLLTSCGSSSVEDLEPDLGPANLDFDVPRYVVPITTNGFSLMSETVTFENGDVFREIEYELNAENNTISQTIITPDGERILEMIFTFDEDGQIVTEEVVRPDGEIGQSSEHFYDNERRLVTTNLSIADEPFLTTSYFFNDVEAPFRNIVRAAADGSEVSRTTFQYDNERILTSSILTTPILPGDIRKIYTFSEDGSQLLTIDEEIEGGKTFEYDANGNVIREITRDSDDVTTLVSVFRYERTGPTVPNLILYQLTYAIDRLF